MSSKTLFEKFRPTMVTILVYMLLLLFDAIVTWINATAGAWFTIALILANLGYLGRSQRRASVVQYKKSCPLLPLCCWRSSSIKSWTTSGDSCP